MSVPASTPLRPKRAALLSHLKQSLGSATTAPSSTPTVSPQDDLSVTQPPSSDDQLSAESLPQDDPAMQSLPALPLDDSSLQAAQIPPSPQVPPSDSDSLDSVAQAVPIAVEETQDIFDSLNPPNPTGGTLKESREPGFSLEQPQLDQVPGVQYVEQEKSAELPPEVEAYLSKVEDLKGQLPSEVVITDPQAIQHQPTKYLAKPVIVLPITPEVEKEAKWKGPKFSVKWLVEFSHKMMKMFSGQVIYRTEDPN